MSHLGQSLQIDDIRAMSASLPNLLQNSIPFRGGIDCELLAICLSCPLSRALGVDFFAYA